MSMLSGKVLRQVLDKMLKSPAAQEARVQVVLPDGKYCVELYSHVKTT